MRKGSINQRVDFRFGSGLIHHSSHFELWTLEYWIREDPLRVLSVFAGGAVEVEVSWSLFDASRGSLDEVLMRDLMDGGG